MITAQHAKEAVCRSYITAIVAAARQNLWFGGEFDYGVDGIVRLVEPRGSRFRETGFSIDFQAKASCDWTEANGNVTYDLEAKAYNDLVERAGQTRVAPFFLFLCCLPKSEADWVHATTDCLTVRHSSYFLKLSGTQTPNTATVRISIPRTNLLTPQNLTSILTDVRDGRILP